MPNFMNPFANIVAQPYMIMKPNSTKRQMLFDSSYPNKKISSMPKFARSHTMTTNEKKKKAPRAGSIATTLRKMEPAKHATKSIGVGLLGNTIVAANITAQVTQGTTNTQRIGDFAYLEALKLNYVFESPPASGAYTYRLIVGYTGEEYAGTTLASGQLASGEIFLPGTGSSYGTLSIINPKAFTVLYDTTVDINSQIANISDIRSGSVVISLKSKFPYQASLSVFGKTRNLTAVVIAFSAGGSPAISCGAAYLDYDLIFKDI